MPVQQLSCHPQGRDGHSVEYLLVFACDSSRSSDEFIPLKVVSVITDVLFTGSPAVFELAETVVLRLRPAKAEMGVSVPAIPPDGLPHDEVVRPEVLVIFV
jgi:hypothetical protein